MTDDVGQAIYTISTDVYNDMLKNPNNLKKVGEVYLESVDGVINGTTHNLGTFRTALVDNVVETAALPLEIATGVAKKFTNIIFGGGVMGYSWLILLLVVVIILIWFYYQIMVQPAVVPVSV